MDPSSSSSTSADDANPPRYFLNWSVVQRILQQVTDGALVRQTILMKLDGSLLTTSRETAETQAAAAAAADAEAAAEAAAAAAAAGDDTSLSGETSTALAPTSSSPSSSSSTASRYALPKIIGALVANMWKHSEINGVSYLGAQQLQQQLIECEGGVVMVSRLSRFLICIYAVKAMPIGLLRQKMNELLIQLEPLQSVYAS